MVTHTPHFDGHPITGGETVELEDRDPIEALQDYEQTHLRPVQNPAQDPEVLAELVMAAGNQYENHDHDALLGAVLRYGEDPALRSAIWGGLIATDIPLRPDEYASILPIPEQVLLPGEGEMYAPDAALRASAPAAFALMKEKGLEHSNTAAYVDLINTGRRPSPEALEEGLTARNEKGRTLLHAAALRRNPASFQDVLRSGIDVNAQDEHGETVFHALFSDEGHKIGAKPHHTTKYIESLVEMAVAGDADPTITDQDGNTLFHTGARNSLVMDQKYNTRLVDRGVDINAFNGKGLTALDIAVHAGNLDDVLHLHDAGAQVSPERRTAAAEFALERGSASLLSSLVGSKPFIPVGSAARWQDADEAPDAWLKSDEGKKLAFTATKMAMDQNRPEIIRAAYDGDVDFGHRNEAGQTALAWAHDNDAKPDVINVLTQIRRETIEREVAQKAADRALKSTKPTPAKDNRGQDRA